MTTVFFPLFILSLVVFAGNGFSDNSGRRRQGPPEEAYTACEGKAAGDMAEFVSPRGDTVTGTCAEQDGRLVLRPDNPPQGKSGGKRRNPPEEAYTACEGKAVGDTAELVTPRGDTVTGTCAEQDGRLVLRPDRKQGSRTAGR